MYVHFPYCGVKCPYCDFNSHVLDHDDRRYGDAILLELAARGHALRETPEGLASVYFGGGTPSRWAPAEVGRVLAALEARYGFRTGIEITLEANPELVDAARFEAYRGVGINRFSIGCQSFDDAELTALGRAHDGANAVSAIRAAQSTGARVSLDLIYGLPKQTEAAALRSVETALELQPDHVSAYTLTIEPHTALARRVRLGTFQPMPDDAQAELIEVVSGRLEDAGYRRYEVSSYAREGRVAVHNTAYWFGSPYLGLGAGAHGFELAVDGRHGIRRENVRGPDRYLETTEAGHTEARFEEERNLQGLAADRATVAFRTIFGLDLEAWGTELGPGFRVSVVEAGLAALARQGFLTQSGLRWRPTPKGLLFNDALARVMLELCEEGFSGRD